MSPSVDDERQEIRCTIVGGPRLWRDALRVLVANSRTLSVAGETAADDDLHTVLKSQRPDVILLVVDPDSESGDVLLRRLPELADQQCLLMIPGPAHGSLVHHVVGLGVRGVITTMDSGQLLVKALLSVAAGEVWLDRASTAAVVNQLTRRHAPVDQEMQRIASLTPREREIVALVTEGCTNQDVAERLEISPATARNHLTSILEKLNVNDRFQLAVYAFRRGLVRTPPVPTALRPYAIMREATPTSSAETAQSKRGRRRTTSRTRPRSG
jgi:DNA-binding NarL/FixJ family response regulator